jgi:carotenoid 1,2-hydratase
VSDDGDYAVVVIAMIGNPFSPWYARAREQGPASPLAFSAMNVCVYGPRSRMWALTERHLDAGSRDGRGVSMGASRMEWVESSLVVRLDEVSTPRKRPIRGRLRFEPLLHANASVWLDAQHRHTWWPVAPRGRIIVDLEEPRLRFTGTGYHDANAGEIPLEHTFSRWSWSRGDWNERVLVTYDVVERDGALRARAWMVGDAGDLTPIDAPRVTLPPSRWFRVGRDGRSEAGVRVLRELEDTPFYARALVQTRLHGQDVAAMHETVSFDRFRARWVRALLGYRMARS